MTPILEGNTGSSNTLPGPVRKIVCQAGQVIVIDPTETPPTCTVLNPDDVFEGEGKAGLRIYDVDGSRLYWESTFEGENRTDSQLVTAPDARPRPTRVVSPVGPVRSRPRALRRAGPILTVDNPPTQRGDTDETPTGGTGPLRGPHRPGVEATSRRTASTSKVPRKTDIIAEAAGVIHGRLPRRFQTRKREAVIKPEGTE
jgi:hypothetical protein